MAENIIGVYKITNTVTGDFYIGSSKDVKRRWREHKKPSAWKQCPNNPMYLDMQKYGVDKFEFEILEEVEIEKLKETEQKFIETLKPAYNNRNANSLNNKRKKEYLKEYLKEYQKSDKRKEYLKEYMKSDKYKEYMKEYTKSNKCKEYQNKYHNQLCSYNSETLTLCVLAYRFKRAGAEHPTIEAKKYIIKN